jgi:hypothetical protein
MGPIHSVHFLKVLDGGPKSSEIEISFKKCSMALSTKPPNTTYFTYRLLLVARLFLFFWFSFSETWSGLRNACRSDTGKNPTSNLDDRNVDVVITQLKQK